MKLDVANLRYLSKDDFRILSAIETGMRNHEVVPTELIASIAGLRGGGIHKLLGDLLRAKLISHEHLNYEGYTLTYPGYDFLALKAFLQRGTITGVGRQIGVGKESDIFMVEGPRGEVYALKLQRLGRTSFRAVKSKRDYLKHRRSASWLYLSRLAALKEYAFMKALGDAGFPVPKAVDQNRHALVMTLARGRNLSLLRTVGPSPGAVFSHLMSLMLRLASHGLVHCDFNEFNLLVQVPGLEAGTIAGLIEAGAKARQEQHGDGSSVGGDDDGHVEGPSAGITPFHPLSVVPGSGEPPVMVTLIDFPQMVSIDHPNARELFERDIRALAAYFARRFDHTPETVPSWSDAVAAAIEAGAAGHAMGVRLDQAVEASGFSAKQAAEFDELMAEQGGSGLQDDAGAEYEDEEEQQEEGAVEQPAAAAEGAPAFVTVAADVLEGNDEEDGEEGDEDEENDEDGSDDDDDEDDDEGDEAPEGLDGDDPNLAAERVPDGVRARHGRRPKPAGGEAYLRRSAEESGSSARGGDTVAGVSRADIRAKVKGAAEKARAREAQATIAHRAGKAHKSGSMKLRDKVKMRELTKAGGSDGVWG